MPQRGCSQACLGTRSSRLYVSARCLQVKLVLEAFQLSAAQAVAYPRAPGLLRCLMAGRLATAQLSPALQAWLAEQRVQCYADGRASLQAFLPRCLVPLTPSLDQAGGLARLTLRGHVSEVTKVPWYSRWEARGATWGVLLPLLCGRPNFWCACGRAAGGSQPGAALPTALALPFLSPLPPAAACLRRCCSRPPARTPSQPPQTARHGCGTWTLATACCCWRGMRGPSTTWPSPLVSRIWFCYLFTGV